MGLDTATGYQLVALLAVAIIGATALAGVITLALLDHEAHMKARRAKARFDRRTS
jgi:uncharacterized membrane protein